MPELPYEIWLQIVEYLPVHQVQHLYLVNRALFNIALDLRYKKASLGLFPDRVIDETRPPILQNPLIASRPTNLQINFYSSAEQFGPIPIQKHSSLKSFLHTIIDKTRGRKTPFFSALSPTDKLAQVTGVMPRLTRLTGLTFAYEKGLDRPNDADASLIFPQALRIIGNRLQALHIQSTFAIYLPPRLESLHTFSIDAVRPSHTPGIHTVMLGNVPIFLQAHQSTIRNVSFSIDDHVLDVSPILTCLQLMSCLHTLHLSLRYHPMGTTEAPFDGVRSVLETHGPNLRVLSLTMLPVPIPFIPLEFHQTWFLVRLPNLRYLSIHAPGLFDDKLGTYVKRFSSSLISLKIKHSFNKWNHLQNFCKDLSDFPYLQDLSLSIFEFHPGDLFIFAKALPHLHSLFVDYSSVYRGEDFTWEYSPLFSKWALESFDFRTRHSKDDDWIAREVAIRLPNVLWIQNRPRQVSLLRAPAREPRILEWL